MHAIKHQVRDATTILDSRYLELTIHGILLDTD
jgi:hypothetical protein